MEHVESKKDKDSNSLRELLQLKQLELDQALINLSEEVDMWNLRLEHVASTEPHAYEILPRLAQEAVNSLDEQWSFYGDKIHVTGKWYVTDFSIDNDTINFPMVEQDAFNIVKSNGFSVFKLEDQPPKVGLSFAYGNFPILSAGLQGNLLLLSFADPSDVSLYYVQPGDKEALQSDISDLANQITYYDQLLFLHYHDSNSEFYRKSAKKQQQFLDKVADTINDSLPSPEHGYNAICEEVQVPYVYRRVTDSLGSKWQRVAAKDSEPILLNGMIEGIGILESIELTNQKPLRSKQELVDPDAGICMILQVEECSIPDIFNGQPVYVPLRMADPISIVVP